MIQPCPLILYHSKVIFIHVLSPFSSIIKHFPFVYIMRLSIHRFPLPNQRLLSKIIFLMGWFGIKFQNSLHTTHVHSPRPSEILHLYHLPSIIPLYPSFLSSISIKYLVLHTLSLGFSQHLTDVFLSTIFSPPLHPPLIHQSISSCFTLQPSPTQYTW